MCVSVWVYVCLCVSQSRPLLMFDSGSRLLLSFGEESVPAAGSAMSGFVTVKLSSCCLNLGMVSWRKSQTLDECTDLKRVKKKIWGANKKKFCFNDFTKLLIKKKLYVVFDPNLFSKAKFQIKRS